MIYKLFFIGAALCVSTISIAQETDSTEVENESENEIQFISLHILIN